MPKRKRSQRVNPNILIAGTPCTGKSRLSKAIADRKGLKWIEASKEAVSRGCITGHDDVLDCDILDEDKLLDSLEPVMCDGGVIVDYHGCEFFPERWFDAVFILRTDNTILHDRLTDRDYSKKKVMENISCEIFGTILEEAKESYKEDIVHELRSDVEQDFDQNFEQIIDWVECFQKIKK